MARKDSLQNLHAVLLKRRDALRRAIAGDLSLLRELQQSGDVVDAALDTAQDEITSQLAESASRDLVNVETALKRFKDGAYGVCESCEGNIPLQRLQALPFATTCIKCQREAEEGGRRGVPGYVIGGQTLNDDNALTE